MVDKVKLYEAADSMVARGVAPTNDNLIEALGGGSKSHTNGMFGDWRRDRRYFRALHELDLTEDMAKALAKVVKVLTTAVGAREPGQSSAEVIDHSARMTELEVRNAALEREVGRLLDCLDAGGVTRPAHRDGERTKGAYAATQRYFWDKVMQEIHGKLNRGEKPLPEILQGLDPDTLSMAHMLGGRSLTPGRLARQMRIRVDQDYYFFEPTEGVFGWIARTRAHPRRPGGAGRGIRRERLGSEGKP